MFVAKIKTFLKGVDILNNKGLQRQCRNKFLLVSTSLLCKFAEVAKRLRRLAATQLIMGSSPILRFFIFKNMKKTILLVLLLILIVGCAKVSETKAPAKETVKEIIAGPAAEEPEKEDSQAVTIVAEGEQEPEEMPVEAAGPTVAQALILVGETKTIAVGDKKYEVKLMSAASRAQFLVNSEVTKDLMLNGVHILRDQAELKLLNIGYNSATIQIKLKEAAPVPAPSDAIGSSAIGPQTLKSGVFTTVAKTTTGQAKIVRTEEEKIILQLVGFRTEPGPGLYVYLIDQGITGGLEVAKLVSREGGQQYDLPIDVDLAKYKKAVIYSKSESKIYGQAILS